MQDQETKTSPLTDRSTWTRMLYMVLFLLALHVLELALILLIGVQFLSKLFRGEVFPELTRLGLKMANYTRDILSFLTFSSEEIPWPFGFELEDEFGRSDSDSPKRA